MKKKHDYEGISHSFRVSEQNTQKLETRSLLMILHITSIFVPSKYETVAVLPKIWGVQTLLHYLSINKKFNAKNCILILQRKRVLRDPRNCIWQVIPQFSSMELVQPKKKNDNKLLNQLDLLCSMFSDQLRRSSMLYESWFRSARFAQFNLNFQSTIQ